MATPRRKAKVNNVWTAVVMAQVLMDTTSQQAVIVTPDEWQAASTGFKHATLLRIRGWISIAKVQAVDTAQGIFLAIYVDDQTSGSASPGVAATYNTEDILWSGGVSFAGSDAASLESLTSFNLDVDVKAMRRIDSGESVRFVFTSTVNSAAVISGVLRGLVRLS